MKRPSDARLCELAEILNDWNGTELGPLDRQQLREAVIELQESRRAKKAAAPAGAPPSEPAKAPTAT
jgi:hypothetical protein